MATDIMATSTTELTLFYSIRLAHFARFALAFLKCTSLRSVQADLGVRMTGGDISLMGDMIEKGWLGRKSGQGFYTYDLKNPKAKKTISPEVRQYAKDFVKRDLGLKEEEVQNRIVSRFINEAVMCLQVSEKHTRATTNTNPLNSFGTFFARRRTKLLQTPSSATLA